MPRLLILYLHRRRRRATLSGRRMAHSEPARSQQPASSVEVAVGLLVIFMTLLTPCGYVLRNLNHFRRD